MGKKKAIVPLPAINKAVDNYAARLDVVVAPWENEGWAIQPSSSRNSAACKQKIEDLRATRVAAKVQTLKDQRVI